MTKGNIPVLDWATDKAQSKALGSDVFPISGTGGAGAALTSGTLIDETAQGFRHTAPIGTDFQGGPIINVDGKVIGVASLTYAPLGYDDGAVHWAPSISAACNRVLTCGGADADTGQARRLITGPPALTTSVSRHRPPWGAHATLPR